MTKLDKAIKHFGTASKMARALGIKPQAIYQWDGKIPRLRAFEIERVTKGKLKADDLSPIKIKAS